MKLRIAIRDSNEKMQFQNTEIL